MFIVVVRIGLAFTCNHFYPRSPHTPLLPRGHLHFSYNGTDGGTHTSSWGGAVLKGSDGTYHMWAAEMTE